jgi:hypothetical protein
VPRRPGPTDPAPVAGLAQRAHIATQHAVQIAREPASTSPGWYLKSGFGKAPSYRQVHVAAKIRGVGRHFQRTDSLLGQLVQPGAAVEISSGRFPLSEPGHVDADQSPGGGPTLLTEISSHRAGDHETASPRVVPAGPSLHRRPLAGAVIG